MNSIANTEKWSIHITTWEASNISQAEYCRQNNLKPHTFWYWKRRLRQSVEKAFVELAPPASPLLELQIHEDLRLEFRININFAWTSGDRD